MSEDAVELVRAIREERIKELTLKAGLPWKPQILLEAASATRIADENQEKALEQLLKAAESAVYEAAGAGCYFVNVPTPVRLRADCRKAAEDVFRANGFDAYYSEMTNTLGVSWPVGKGGAM